MEINNTLKQVLWVEEKQLIHRAYQQEAEAYGLQLIPFNCWDDAYQALKGNFETWSAIILQPRSKVDAGGYPNPKQFLPQAFSDINVICALKNKKLPWYLFTNINPSDFQDLVLKGRKEFDEGWDQCYYNSDVEEERKLLFERIKQQTQLSERLQIRSGQYKCVIDALQYLENHNLSSSVRVLLEDILVSVTFGTANYHKIGETRLILEYLFDSMIRNGLLPNDMTNASNKMNNNSCWRLLSGQSVSRQDNTNYVMRYPIMNKIMACNIKTILDLGNSNQHAAITDDAQELTDYMNDVGTNYLLYSITLQLCDVILWYEKIIRKIQETGTIYRWWKVSY